MDSKRSMLGRLYKFLSMSRGLTRIELRFALIFYILLITSLLIGFGRHHHITPGKIYHALVVSAKAQAKVWFFNPFSSPNTRSDQTAP